MRLGQIKWQGSTTAAIFNHATARPIPDYTLCDLICAAEKRGARLSDFAEELAIPRSVPAEPLIPIQPREVWASRPEIFLKGTARSCVGPGQPIGMYSNSTCLPDVALVLGANGKILGYTLAAHTPAFHASCALGPIVVTADEILDPSSMRLTCTVVREGAVIFSAEARCETNLGEMLDSLLQSNPVPAGSVFLTSAVVMDAAKLFAGDSVKVHIEQIGELTNSIGFPQRAAAAARV
jgi:2-dehydro-3-deoxy-D-arabinonate dehydratase